MSENYFRNISYNFDVENAVPNPLLQKCIVEFYRSDKQSNKKFGKKDDEYNGEFGFDRFDKEICPSASIQGEGAYEILGGISPEEEIVSGLRKYPCPFMSIWPPGVEGNENNSKSTVTVYVKAKQVKDKPETGTHKIRFKSNNRAAITVNGQEEVTLSLTLGAEKATPLIIQCLKAFGDENATPDKFIYSAVHIDAYIEDEFDAEEDAHVGQLIIIPNRFIYYTNLIPVIVRVKETETSSTEKFLNPYPQHIEDFCNNELPDYLNKKSFNQGLIFFKCNSFNLQKLDINKGEFQQNLRDIFGTELIGTKDQKLKFVDNIEQLYQKKLFNSNIEYEKENAKQISQVNEKIRRFVHEFGRRFRYRIENGTRRNSTNQIATQAWSHRQVQEKLQEFLLAEKLYIDLLAAKGIDINGQGKLDKTHKTHIFFFADIEKTAPMNPSIEGDGYVPAFSPTGQGTAYIFTSCLSNPLSKELVTHEIGHALGLKHTFNDSDDSDTIAYEESGREDKAYFEKEINKTNSKIEQLENKKNNPQLSSSEKFLSSTYPKIDQYINKENLFEYDEMSGTISRDGIFIWDRIVNTFITDIKNATECETIGTEGNSVDSHLNIEIDQEIVILKAEIANLEAKKRNSENSINLKKYKRITDTLENYMDYKKSNENFEYKMFNYQQWRKIQGIFPYLDKVKID